MSIETLLSRRSVRSYDINYEIPQDTLHKIVEAVMNSPTAMNCQDYNLVVCTSREKLFALANSVMSRGEESMKERFLERQKQSGVSNPVTYDAPCVIFLEKNERATGKFTEIDAGIISMAIMIAAKAEGLDSVCLGCIGVGLTEEIENILELQHGKCVIAVALGKAKEGCHIVDKKIISSVKYVK